MNEPTPRKLKFVLDRVPPGFLIDSRWLTRNGVTKGSAHAYQQAQWLERVSRGLYRRPFGVSEPTDPGGWKIPVLSAQWIMQYDFHVGGFTALGLGGHSHYLTLGRESDVYLYGDVPAWLSRLDLDAKLVLRSRKLFDDNSLGVDDRDFDPFAEDCASPWRWSIRVSTPERAILEALNELPGRETFDSLDMAFQSLANLRPRRLAELLGTCQSVKVKRLFFLFADRHRHAWLKHLERADFDLGRGARALTEGGKLHPIYQIVVPAKYAYSIADHGDGA